MLLALLLQVSVENYCISCRLLLYICIIYMAYWQRLPETCSSEASNLSKLHIKYKGRVLSTGRGVQGLASVKLSACFFPYHYQLYALITAYWQRLAETCSGEASNLSRFYIKYKWPFGVYWLKASYTSSLRPLTTSDSRRRLLFSTFHSR
jgi:hypothetical protein